MQVKELQLKIKQLQGQPHRKDAKTGPEHGQQERHERELRQLEGMHGDKIARMTAEHDAEVETVRLGMRGVMAAEMEAATTLHQQV